MTVFSQINHEVITDTKRNIKIIAAKRGVTQKELLDEAIAFLLEKYKQCLIK